MTTVKAENGYFWIQFDDDLKTIYTPLYFQTIHLTAEVVMQPKMKGGSYKNLTFPYSYFVYMVEKNPISTAVKWIDIKGILNGALAKRTKEEEKQKIEEIEKRAEKKAEEIEKQAKKKAEEQAEEIEKQAKKKAEEQAEEIEKQAKKKAEEQAEEIEKQAEKNEKPAEGKAEIGFFSNIKGWFKPAENQLTAEPVAISNEITVQESPEATETPYIIKIKIKDNVPHNGKPLNQILDEYKRSERTIETLMETGLPYTLIEKIAYDIDSQDNHLEEIYGLHFSDLRHENIFNINGHYLVLEPPRHERKLAEFVRRLVGSGRVENTRLARDFEIP